MGDYGHLTIDHAPMLIRPLKSMTEFSQLHTMTNASYGLKPLVMTRMDKHHRSKMLLLPIHNFG